MALGTVRIGGLDVGRLIIGGNPFSGFSHQGTARDLEMKKYFTAERIKAALRSAEELGINTHIGRADHHVMRVLLEYWDQGGKIQWFAQTCPELGEPSHGIRNGIAGGAKAAFIHGGQMDFMLANGQLDKVPGYLKMIKDAGLAAGVAGHNVHVFEKCEEMGLAVDFYMCCYYNPTDRSRSAEHIHGADEKFRAADRDAMAALIGKLSKPAIHYKILAAGRTDPEQAFAFAARHLRPQDAVCIGVFPKDKPGMLAEDLALLEKHLD